MMNENQLLENLLSDDTLFNDVMHKLTTLNEESLIRIKAYRREIEKMSIKNDKNVKSCINKITKLAKIYNKVDELLQQKK